MLTDTTIGALVLADTEAAILYAKCSLRHQAAVDAYNAARSGKR